MKCPKCGYLGFETSDRCRNCGYDFSLSVHVETPHELPLQERAGPGAPLADFDLVEPERSTHIAGLDLDRLIGTESALEESPAVIQQAPMRAPARTAPEAVADRGLPLFSPGSGGAGESDDTPLITTPRPVRAPLSVRRATPDVPRGRPRTPRPRRDDANVDLDLETPAANISQTPVAHAVEASPARSAGLFARLFAMTVDVMLLGGINAAVIYLTLAIAGLTLADFAIIPPVPMVAFLLLLNGGYLVGFTAACGQTIGKMLTHIRVVNDEGGRVDVGAAVVRASGCLVSLLTAGLGYVPAFVTPDARALQDRLAHTRVVRIR